MATAAAARRLRLPMVDLASRDRRAAAKSIRQVGGSEPGLPALSFLGRNFFRLLSIID
jgi:hypothetical protein